MKKIILTIAALLVVLIPTYVLLFQAAKTAAPEADISGTAVTPAFVRWSVTNRSGEDILTSQSEKKAQKQFEKATPTALANAGALSQITFSRAPSRNAVFFFDLSGAGHTYDPMTLSDLTEKGAPVLTGKTQIVLTVEWDISSAVRVRCAYSFEVTA